MSKAAELLRMLQSRYSKQANFEISVPDYFKEHPQYEEYVQVYKRLTEVRLTNLNNPAANVLLEVNQKEIMTAFKDLEIANFLVASASFYCKTKAND